jgi:hypothetical protein
MPLGEHEYEISIVIIDCQNVSNFTAASLFLILRFASLLKQSDNIRDFVGWRHRMFEVALVGLFLPHFPTAKSPTAKSPTAKPDWSCAFL